jgi:hypothetical protein
MYVSLNLKTIKFYFIKLATNFKRQTIYLVGERALLSFQANYVALSHGNHEVQGKMLSIGE